MKDFISIENCLNELGCAFVSVEGTSMLPLLPQNKSKVQLEAVGARRVKEGDVVLYKRADGTMVLHRVIKILANDMFAVCADHQYKPLEKIHKGQIIAVAQGFFINGQYFDDYTLWYRMYKAVWNGSFILRRFCLAFLRLSGIEKYL